MKNLILFAAILATFSACKKDNPSFVVTYETTCVAPAEIIYKDATGAFDTVYKTPGNFIYSFELSQYPKQRETWIQISTLPSFEASVKLTINDSIIGSTVQYGGCTMVNP